MLSVYFVAKLSISGYFWASNKDWKLGDFRLLCLWLVSKKNWQPCITPSSCVPAFIQGCQIWQNAKKYQFGCFWQPLAPSNLAMAPCYIFD